MTIHYQLHPHWSGSTVFLWEWIKPIGRKSKTTQMCLCYLKLLNFITVGKTARTLSEKQKMLYKTALGFKHFIN